MVQAKESETPLVVQLTRLSGALTFCGGIILLVAADGAIGIAVVLLSALYFALAEIIAYLAVIARNTQPQPDLIEELTEHFGSETDLLH